MQFKFIQMLFFPGREYPESEYFSARIIQITLTQNIVVYKIGTLQNHVVLSTTVGTLAVWIVCSTPAHELIIFIYTLFTEGIGRHLGLHSVKWEDD